MYRKLLFAIGCLMASSPVAAQSDRVVPKKLTLPQAEELLLQRNLPILTARYQVEANRAARLIAGYKPNPVVTLGGEQVPFYSPLEGTVPRFFATDSNAGANPVYTFRVDK